MRQRNSGELWARPQDSKDYYKPTHLEMMQDGKKEKTREKWNGTLVRWKP
jgi:hypothetical protein